MKPSHAKTPKNQRGNSNGRSIQQIVFFEDKAGNKVNRIPSGSKKIWTRKERLITHLKGNF